jgi:hypothetical protein
MKPLDHENAFLHRQAEVAQAISGRPELKVSIGLNRIHDEPLALRESIIIGRPLADSSGENRRASAWAGWIWRHWR